MKNLEKLKSGDLVFLKTGAMGVIQEILHNVFGDNEHAYKISFINNQTTIKRSKDFLLSI